MTTMKASVYNEYGSPDVLQLKEVAKPIPQENEVLVKIIATTVTAVDSAFRQGDPYNARLYAGLTKPKNRILGMVHSSQNQKISPMKKLLLLMLG